MFNYIMEWLIILLILILLYIINYYLSNNENFYNEKLDAAIIVEPRKNPMLIKVLKNFLKLLPKNTIIYIFHGTDNEKYIYEYFYKQINNGKIILIRLNKKNLTIKDYNLLLVSKKFYNMIKGENLLIFQMDTCLCSNTKYKFQDFFMYDYVGAPWMKNNLNIKNVKNKVGNGGLSLRKKSSILKHIDNHTYKGEPEDVYFAKSNTLKFPSIEKAAEFSTEHLLNPYSMGFHKPDVHLSESNKKIVRNICPEFQEVFESK